MFTLNVLAATRTIEKTMPFMLYRLLLCLGLGLTFLLATLIGAGTVVAFSSFAKNPAAMAGLGGGLGFIACACGTYYFRTTWLKTLTASHLALLVAQIRQGDIPEGKAQIDYAAKQVSTCFASAAELNKLDQAIKTSLMDTASLYPLQVTSNPALQKAVNKWVGWLFASHHQTVLAWHFYSGTPDGWNNARVAISCLAGHFRLVLRNRLIMAVFEWLGWAGFYALMLYPTGLVAHSLPVAIGTWQYVFAAVFAWCLKMAFLEPISEATLMEGILPHIKAMPEQEAALAEHSGAFKLIRQQGQTH